MSLIHVTTRVINLDGSGTPYEAEFQVETGAVDCLGPSDRLHAAGIQPEGKAAYELANGDSVEYEYGFARVALMGQETVVQIIFGPDDAEPILGVVALENMGVTVDPVTRVLRRLHAKPLKHFGSSESSGCHDPTIQIGLTPPARIHSLRGQGICHLASAPGTPHVSGKRSPADLRAEGV